MRFVSFDDGSGTRAGVLREGRVHDLGGVTLLELVQAGGLDRTEPAGGEGVALEDVQLLPPLDRPGKLILIGLNYLEHAREAGLEAPEMPTFFAKWANALVPSGATVSLPPWTDKVDYECEVAFVIGTECKDVPAEQFADVIAGYTLLNDLSARDYQFKTPQWMPGKVFDGAAPMGPTLVTPDEAGPPDAIEIGTRLNGEVMQSSSTADLIHSIPVLVEYLSKLMTLESGDIVATGTPSGVGSMRDPKVWLKPGDEVEVFSAQLGSLHTTIA
jgi:2-keto-4-pentenoate hydratase/2-oxohepta-3-ene-1,7-dioic acid hydratase in catechol pathway